MKRAKASESTVGQIPLYVRVIPVMLTLLAALFSVCVMAGA